MTPLNLQHGCCRIAAHERCYIRQTAFLRGARAPFGTARRRRSSPTWGGTPSGASICQSICPSLHHFSRLDSLDTQQQVRAIMPGGDVRSRRAGAAVSPASGTECSMQRTRSAGSGRGRAGVGCRRRRSPRRSRRRRRRSAPASQFARPAGSHGVHPSGHGGGPAADAALQPAVPARKLPAQGAVPGLLEAVLPPPPLLSPPLPLQPP